MTPAPERGGTTVGVGIEPAERELAQDAPIAEHSSRVPTVDPSLSISGRPAADIRTHRAGDAPAVEPARDPSGLDRLLTTVVERLRTIHGTDGPSLESRLHHPDIGDIRVVVAGRIGETIRAELVTTDRQSAEMLARAVDRYVLATAHGLAGIDLHVRAASSQADAGSNGSSSRSWDQASGQSTNGNSTTADSSTGQSRREAPMDASDRQSGRALHDVPSVSADVAARRTGRAATRHITSSIDLRA